MRANSSKRDIEAFLLGLQQEIDNVTIKSEAHIETRVAVITDKERDEWAAGGLPREMNPPRLLSILGYEEKDMERQRSIKVGSGGHTIIPDFIVSQDDREFFVLDVKAPNVNLDSATGQIFDYLFQTNIALGILFNGKDMDIYVNRRLTKRPTDANNGNPLPLRVISASGVEQLAEIWCRFLKPTSDESTSRRTDWSVTVAKALIREHKREETGRERKREIGRWLTNLLANPGETLLKAIQDAKLSPDEHELTVRQMQEALEIHNKINTASQIPNVKKRGDINPKVRELVGQVCREHGVDFLQKRKITNLRIRGWGNNGYYPVPGQNNLYVGNVSGNNGRRIIDELEQLLTAPSSLPSK